MIGRLRQLVNQSADAVLARLEARDARRWSTAPICAAPLATPDEYRRIWADAKTRAYPVVDAYEAECGAAIDADWLQSLALPTQITVKKSAICYQHGRVLYATLRRYLREREREQLTIVETGTARGFSSLCMARAMDDAGATGKILTFDVLPHDAPMLWNCLLDADGPRTRAQLLSDYARLIERYIVFFHGDSVRALHRMSAPRVHVAFLDAVHTYDQVLAECAAVCGRQQRGDLIVFDDYTSSYPGVIQAADQVCRTHGYDGRVIEASDQRRYLIAERR